MIVCFKVDKVITSHCRLMIQDGFVPLVDKGQRNEILHTHLTAGLDDVTQILINITSPPESRLDWNEFFIKVRIVSCPDNRSPDLAAPSKNSQQFGEAITETARSSKHGNVDN